MRKKLLEEIFTQIEISIICRIFENDPKNFQKQIQEFMKDPLVKQRLEAEEIDPKFIGYAIEHALMTQYGKENQENVNQLIKKLHELDDLIVKHSLSVENNNKIEIDSAVLEVLRAFRRTI